MKSITDFNSDDEYYDYITVYFSGLAMQSRVNYWHSKENVNNRRQDIDPSEDLARRCIKDADSLVRELKIKFKK